MRVIKTELGVDLYLAQAPERYAMTALHYPLTMDLCLGARARRFPFDQVFDFRQVEIPVVRDRIAEAAAFFHRNPDKLPDQVKRLSSACHLIKHLFPSDNLSMIAIGKGDGMQHFTFSAGSGRMLRNGHQIMPPPDANVPKAALWNSFKPHMVVIAMDGESVASKLMLRNVETTFGTYSVADMDNARQRRFDQLLVLRPERMDQSNGPDALRSSRRIR